MKHRQLAQGKGGLELLEEALYLLRTVPVSTLTVYYIGSLPFMLGLLYFWSEMSRSALAEERLAASTCVLTLLFVWMKLWQGVFARRLLATLTGAAPPRWTAGRLWRAAGTQAIVQPSGLFLLPLSLIPLLPFGWLYAFYQSVTVLGDGREHSALQVVKKAWRQAVLWPRQNHIALLVLKLFGILVFVNIVSAFLAVPFLLQKLLGVETPFGKLMQDPERLVALLLNTTFLTAAMGLTYLCVDPLVKAWYTLRCFYGESLRTGEDLRAELVRLSAPNPLAMGVVLLCLSVLPVQIQALTANHRIQTAPAFLKPLEASKLLRVADPRSEPSAPTAAQGAAHGIANRTDSPLSPEALDQSIEEVISQREYTWRLPRERSAEQSRKPNLLAIFLRSVGDAMGDSLKTLARWTKKLLDWLVPNPNPQTATSGPGLNWTSVLHGLLVVLLIVLACLLGILVFRLWRRHREQPELAAAQAVLPTPDVADENVGPDQLPEDGWVKLARELLGQGEFRLALRAYYLATLAHLAERQLITLARFKSNREYERELARRQHVLPEIFELFCENGLIFDRVWYGMHQASAALLEQVAGNAGKIKSAA